MRTMELVYGAVMLTEHAPVTALTTVTHYDNVQELYTACLGKADIYQLMTAMCYRSSEIAMMPTIAAMLKKLNDDVITMRVAMKIEA